MFTYNETYTHVQPSILHACVHASMHICTRTHVRTDSRVNACAPRLFGKLDTCLLLTLCVIEAAADLRSKQVQNTCIRGCVCVCTYIV